MIYYDSKLGLNKHQYIKRLVHAFGDDATLFGGMTNLNDDDEMR